ncbi:Uncharacterized protein TCM_011991 [Theobroma cacao]|uniref:Uncharacterized protein n=1 Tax=Theobroma cacao TaxID=3641 RepID=A0A061G0Q2_THECC|nr:Uncharacterized protein TCM_011991 [Theobroma cacao]
MLPNPKAESRCNITKIKSPKIKEGNKRGKPPATIKDILTLTLLSLCLNITSNLVIRLNPLLQRSIPCKLVCYLNTL